MKAHRRCGGTALLYL